MGRSSLLHSRMAQGETVHSINANFGKARTMTQRIPCDGDKWECAAKKKHPWPEPAECDWPMCGCDPKAVAVLAALEDQGISLEKSGSR
jgi:hypothetical protein